MQPDRNGSVLSGLPAIWGGTPSGVATGAPVAPVPVTQPQSAEFLGTFNHPYCVGAVYKHFAAQYNAPLQYTNRDLFHRFYENQMQIAGGTNNAFGAGADSGGMVMGYFTRQPVDIPLWRWARRFVLADNFCQAAFGGSYLNH